MFTDNIALVVVLYICRCLMYSVRHTHTHISAFARTSFNYLRFSYPLGRLFFFVVVVLLLLLFLFFFGSFVS